MHQVFAELFGGVGLFLLGMTLMTNGLKDATGETLKKLLTKSVSYTHLTLPTKA